MKYLIGKFWLWINGWKIEMNVEPEEVRRSVMVAAPHTSNWDFIYAIAAFWSMRINLHFFIKDDYTRSLFGWFFKWMGGLGVDRSKKNELVEKAIHILNQKEDIVILVPAEGTRKRTEKWRSGFYNIAKGAQVPISLGFLDYKKKIAGVAKTIRPTDDFEKDMSSIEKVYLKYTGKNPELYNPVIFIRKKDV